MIDKNKIKAKLEKERDELVSELKGFGMLNPETGDWEAVPEGVDTPEPDQNDAADRFEEFESRSSLMEVLEPRLKNILQALKNIENDSFGKCTVCNMDIEEDRLEANPSATSCKMHMES